VPFGSCWLNNVLILFAHPRFEKSRVNRLLLKAVGGLEGITVRDLYEEYADFNIDSEKEKMLLLEHETIVWQHPLYNYASPPLIKQWIDLVIEYGWAHGIGGDHLKGKTIFNVLTTGGTRQAYSSGGHGFTLREFLAPFEQTARLCGMHYLPPFVVHGTFLLSDPEIQTYGNLYRSLLSLVTSQKFDPDTVQPYEYLNDWIGSQDAAGAT